MERGIGMKANGRVWRRVHDLQDRRMGSESVKTDQYCWHITVEGASIRNSVWVGKQSPQQRWPWKPSQNVCTLIKGCGPPLEGSWVVVGQNWDWTEVRKDTLAAVHRVRLEKMRPTLNSLNMKGELTCKRLNPIQNPTDVPKCKAAGLSVRVCHENLGGDKPQCVRRLQEALPPWAQRSCTSVLPPQLLQGLSISDASEFPGDLYENPDDCTLTWGLMTQNLETP